jgi:hypothetical protein
LQKSGAFPASVRLKEDSENMEREREESKSWRDEEKERKTERKGRNGFQSSVIFYSCNKK